MLSLVPGSDGNVQFLSAPPQLTQATMNPTQTYITLPITIPPSKPGDVTQTFQIQVLNPNPVPQQPKFQMGQMQIPIHGLQQHGTTVLTVAYSPQDGEILPNQMPEGAPVTVLAAIQPQDLHLLAQQNGLAAQQHPHSHLDQTAVSITEEDIREKSERAARFNIKAEPFWGQSPITLSSNPIPNDLSEFFQARNVSLQPYLKLNTDGIKKELFNETLAQIQLGDNNNIISINNNFNADNSNTGMDTSDQNEMDSSNTTEINENDHDEKDEVDVNGKGKKRRKVKKKTPKPKRVKPGQVHIATAIDGTILFCCPECQMAYPEKESLESHLSVHKIERRYFVNITEAKIILTKNSYFRYICDICGAGLKRKEHLERHKLGEYQTEMSTICRLINFSSTGHNPERPYVCNVCLKGFKRKEHLNLHAVIHSGMKTEVDYKF